MSAWRELIEEGRWAPSPHNVQPWRLRVVSERHAELLYEPARLLHDTDPPGRFVTVGLGCFVETLSLAAAPRGLAVEARLSGKAPQGRDGPPRPFARLELVAREGEERLAPGLIRARRTSRRPYDGHAVEEWLLESLALEAAAVGQHLAWSSERGLVDFVVRLNQEALFFDMTDPSARSEVGRWLRFSAAEATQTADGFSPACLGFPGWLLRAFFHRRGIFELPVIRPAVRTLYLRSMQGTASVAWLRGPFDAVDDWFLAGRALCRLWLSLTAAGLSLHPFGSIVTNPSANARLQDRIADDAGEGTMWLIMRVGRSAEPPRSARLPAERLLVG